ncbi:epoxyqueuosine reductase [Methanobrevibacter cuticularis]|uniref:Epoxyqueuosine reductase n=1 Tax=Methanobrevibacter cuticularis TaxID=47311 RepID=A0A166EEZ4_9EURY|nr:epoxyqueuosine reductase [Methanobrevibacter cuticularis]KZX16574.1 epoxyqueuosine reductase [Methanobrevibacter cuticularis]
MDKEITELVKSMALDLGACEVGIVSQEMAKNGPDTVDLSYVLDTAKSAIVFAVPFDQRLIEPYLSKENQDLNLNKIRTTTFAGGIGLEIASLLDQLDYDAVATAPNYAYRKDAPNGLDERKPPLSHIFLGVMSGVGFLGHSGLLLTKNEGSAIALATVVTNADLIPSKQLPAEENYCDKCNLCTAVCMSKYLNKENIKLDIGGEEYETRKYNEKKRCVLVCAGYCGLHPSKKWSTWSSARFKIPGDDENIVPSILKYKPAYLERKRNAGVFYHPLAPGYQMEYSCSNCQFICHPDKKTRKNRYKSLIKSGVVIEDENGDRKAVTNEEAEKFIANIPNDRKKLFVDED